MRRLLWIVAAVALMSAGTAQAQQDVRQRIEGLCAANTQQFAAVANPSVERESIPASTLVEQMAAGVPVEVNGAVITGNLDLNPLLAAGRDGTPVAVRQPVTLADATLDGNLIIPDALQVTAPFSLTGTVITGSVSIGQATFEQPVDFDRVQFGGAVTLTRPTFAAPASFVNVEMLSLVSFVGVTFADVADFSDARIEDQIAFVSNTAFQQNALFDRASFSQRLSFNTVTFERDTYFTEVSFCGSTRLQGITARGIMDFQGSGFASDLRIEAGSRMEADVYLTDTIMDGNLRVRSSAVISGDLLLSGMEFTSGNSLLIQDSTLNGDVDGVGVNFRSSDGLRMVESTFGGELDFTDAQFSETGSFTLLESVFNGDLSLNRALFNNTVSITRSDVNAVADMRGAQFFDNVFIEESTFNDELLFRGATFNAAFVDFHESDFDRIDLSSVSLQPGSLDLVGATYDELIAFDFDLAVLAVPPDPVERFEVYSALERSFRSQGSRELINETTYEASAAECVISARTPDISYLVNCPMSQYFLGYRVRLFPPIRTAIITVLFFGVLYWLGGLKGIPDPDDPTTRRGDSIWDALGLSFDLFFAIRWNQIHVDFENMRLAWVWRGLVLTEWVFGLYILVGLASALANTVPLFSTVLEQLR